MGERWPPVYDAADLESTIKEIASGDSPESWLFSTPASWPGLPSQGDVFRFEADLPYLDEHGDVAANYVEGEAFAYEYWMLVSNSCDTTRDPRDVPFFHTAPLLLLGKSNDLDATQLTALRRYQYSRRFYLPGWSAETEDSHYSVEFCRLTSVSRGLILDGNRVASLSRKGWILLHACLVRFLCRDDGRFDDD